MGIDTHGYSWIPIFLDTWQIFEIQVSKYPKKHVFTPNFLTLGTHRGRGLGLLDTLGYSWILLDTDFFVYLANFWDPSIYAHPPVYLAFSSLFYQSTASVDGRHFTSQLYVIGLIVSIFHLDLIPCKEGR